MDIRVHIGRNPRSQLKNKQERLVVQPRTVVGIMTIREIIAQSSNLTWYRTQHAFALITNLFVIKTNAFFAAIASVLVMKFKALEQLILRKKILSWAKAYCYMITILLE